MVLIMGSQEKVIDDTELDDTERKYLSYAWRLLDGDISGSLPVSQLGVILRAFGKNPSEQEIQYLKYDNGLTDSSRLLLDDVIDLYMKCKSDVDSASKLLSAFKVFDREGTGFMQAKDLRDVLSRLGEPLTETELEEMMTLTKTSPTGTVRYNDICELVMSDNRPFPRT